MSRLHIIVAAMVLLASAAAGAEDISFSRTDVEFDGTSHDRIIADLNGDGKADLGVQYTLSDKPDQYFFHIFYQKAGSGFSENPDVTFKLPQDARLFDAGNVAAQPGDELIVLLEDGMYYYDKGGPETKPYSRTKPLFKSSNLLTGAEPGRPLNQKFMWNLDKKGYDEIVFPGAAGPEIYAMRDSGYELMQKINMKAGTTYRVGGLGDIMTTDDINQFLRFKTYTKRLTANLTIPDIFIEDANGDGRLDIMGLLKNRLQVFCQKPDGTFPDAPNEAVEKQILTAEEKKLSFAGQGMTVTDLNSDGIIDIVMTKWGSTENRSQMTRHIYYGRKGPVHSEYPDQIVASASAAVDFGVYDVNGDGRNDLVIPYIHFAPSQAFKVMMENSIKIQFRVFLMGPDGKYAQDKDKKYAKPDKRKILNYKIDIIGIMLDFQTLIEGKFHPLISFGYDFNGDGIPDIIADTGADKANFYWGNTSADYSQMPDQTIDLESATRYDLGDINGDGKADIITYYESEERVKERRKIAQEAYRTGRTDAVTPEMEAGALLKTKEQTRIKFLVSK